MSLDREKLTGLKESFWKEPINERGPYGRSWAIVKALKKTGGDIEKAHGYLNRKYLTGNTVEGPFTWDTKHPDYVSREEIEARKNYKPESPTWDVPSDEEIEKLPKKSPDDKRKGPLLLGPQPVEEQSFGLFGMPIPDECPKCGDRHTEDDSDALKLCAAKQTGDKDIIDKAQKEYDLSKKLRSAKWNAEWDYNRQNMPFDRGDVVRVKHTGQVGVVASWKGRGENDKQMSYLYNIIPQGYSDPAPYDVQMMQGTEVLDTDLELVRKKGQSEIDSFQRSWDKDNRHVPNESLEGDHMSIDREKLTELKEGFWKEPEPIKEGDVFCPGPTAKEVAARKEEVRKREEKEKKGKEKKIKEADISEQGPVDRRQADRRQADRRVAQRDLRVPPGPEGISYQNDLVTIYGPVENQEEMDRLGSGANWDMVSRPAAIPGLVPNMPSYLDRYLHQGYRVYVVVPRADQQNKYAVLVDHASNRTWFDATNRALNDDQVSQVTTDLGIPG